MTWKGHPRTSTTQWRKTRKQVLDRDHWTCAVITPEGRCNAPANICGHITPWHLGGTDTPDNLRAECQKHADEKTQTEAQARQPRRKRPNTKQHPGFIA